MAAASSAATTRVVQFSEFADTTANLSIESVPVRAPEAGEVVVAITYAAINPVDSLVSKGYLKAAGWAMDLPFHSGYDFSGTVEQVGEGVSDLAVGDQVCAVNWGDHKHDDDAKTVGSAFADRITIPARKVSKVPAGLDLKTAAAFPLVATTAHQALFRELKLSAGDHVLILGGAGAVGTVAIQLAKLRGIKVTTTASPRTTAAVAALGPDAIVDYTSADWSEDESLRGVDAVFDAIGERDGFARAKKVLKTDGGFLSISSHDAGFDPSAHAPLRYAAFMALSNDKAVQDEAAALLAAGSVKLAVDEVFDFTLEGVRAMFAKQDSGKSIGKNLLRTGSA